MEGDRPVEGPTGRRETGVKGKECSNEALRLFEARSDEERRGGDRGSILGKDRSIDTSDVLRGRSGQVDNRLLRRTRSGPPSTTTALREVSSRRGGDNKTQYLLPEPLRSGDVDLSAHGGGGARDRIRERLTSILDRSSLSMVADSDAAAAEAHHMPGWAAYLSMVALMAGSPSSLGADRYHRTLGRFCANYALANGMMFPIEIGNLLEWLVDELPSGEDPSILGPAGLYRPTHDYWALVARVAEIFVAQLEVGPNRYGHVELHLRIARGVLGLEG